MSELSPNQEAHLLRLQKAFARFLALKYTRGAKEHGGELLNYSPKELLDEAIDEVVDQYTYLMTLREKLFGNGRSV